MGLDFRTGRNLVRDSCVRIQSLLKKVEHREHEEKDLAEFVFTPDVGETD